MKSKTLLLLFILGINMSYAQEQEHESILQAPSDWQSEIIPFPISFARDIPLVGYEDLRFAPGWSDSTSEQFWTYCFVWYVHQSEPLTDSLLTQYMQQYYDGLMGVTLIAPDGTTNPNNLDKTTCILAKNGSGWEGQVRVYDRFFTKDYLSLNITIEENPCPKTQKTLIRFELSPQPIASELWKILDQVTSKEMCE